MSERCFHWRIHTRSSGRYLQECVDCGEEMVRDLRISRAEVMEAAEFLQGQGWAGLLPFDEAVRSLVDWAELIGLQEAVRRGLEEYFPQGGPSDTAVTRFIDAMKEQP